ncbi:hypothetical protein C8R43DRAFT_1020982 [Mycena crocata]|nr:hypothetical protein C8R43DRAFT_1020982 [Mycena crocata]
MATSPFSVVTLVIFILSIGFVIFPVGFTIRRKRISINLTTAPIAAIAILWASQCLGPAQIRDGIVGTEGVKPYNILILFFCLAYMAITLDLSGVLEAAAYWVSNKGGTNGRKLYFYFYVMLTLLSVLLGNDPVILSGTVFLVYYTRGANLEPLPWLIAEFASANTASMVLVVGNPTNVILCEGFGINFAAFTLYTILVFLACNVACYIALAFQFRHVKHIPKQLTATKKLNVREALKDPVAACVGSALLFCCILVIMVVSFFKVDVWKITLPFAVAKLIFDLLWDVVRPKPSPFLTQKPKLDEDSSEDNKTIDTQPAISAVAAQSTFASIDPSSITESQTLPMPSVEDGSILQRLKTRWASAHATLSRRFPTFMVALPRLPFALIPFAFSQFILIEALVHQGWIDHFAHWLAVASKGRMHPTIWLVGVLGVFLCNFAGTNIGATILLTKIIRATPGLPADTTRAAGIALAVASNIGAVSFTFSASLAGLLWKTILKQRQEQIRIDEAKDMAMAKTKEAEILPGSFEFAKRLKMTQLTFAKWNILPLGVMTVVGLAVVSAEMAVLY